MEGYLWEKDKIQKARLSLVGKENLDLRIFIDRSVIEVFVNEKLALVQRIYPVKKESNQVILLVMVGVFMFQYWRAGNFYIQPIKYEKGISNFFIFTCIDFALSQGQYS